MDSGEKKFWFKGGEVLKILSIYVNLHNTDQYRRKM